MKTTIVCVVGPPGCGKNFQLTKLKVAGLFPAKYLSSGDTFRDAQKSNPRLWEKVRPYLTGENKQKSRLVPDEILREVMTPQIKRATGLVFLNGIPRTSSQLEWILSFQGARVRILFLQAEYERCLARIANRRDQEGRLDDNAADARERMVEFQLLTVPVLRAAHQCELVRVIDVNGGPEESHTNFLRGLAEILPDHRQILLEHADKSPVSP